MARTIPHREGMCPLCGHEEMAYGVSEIVDEWVMYPWTCGHCGAIGKEWYSMVFDEHGEVMSKAKQDKVMGVCEHDWVDADNEGAYGDEECRICGKKRKKE